MFTVHWMIRVLERENPYACVVLVLVPLIPLRFASLPTPFYNWVTITIAFVLLIALATLMWIRRQNLAMEADHLRRLVESLRLSEEAVRHSERRHREFVEHALYGIFMATDDGQFLDVNPALVAMLGYSSKEELLQQNLDQHIYVTEGLGSLLADQAHDLGRLQDIEVEWRRKDGTQMTVRLSGRAVSGRIELPRLGRGPRVEVTRGIECIVQDLSERQAMRSQIAALQKFEAIGQLAGGIAHDFNNVVGAIQSWAELAKQEAQPDSSLQRRLQRLCNQTARAAAMTRQMLAVSRRQAPETANVSLNDVVCGVEGLLRNLIGSGIIVNTVLAPDLERVSANAAQLEQVVMNLMLNARDAMPKGGRMIIETENREFDQHRFACVSVTDNGCGMDRATRERIFEPFFTTKGAKGTGLGLPTVDRIVRHAGGSITVESEVGQGTIFRIFFPVQPEPVEICLPSPSVYATQHEARIV